MAKIVLAGSIIVDSVKMITEWPQKGMLVPITDIRRSVGGAVANSGIDLKTLDPSIDVAAMGMAGADDAGDFAIDFMRGHGLDVSGIMRANGVPTSFTDVMTVSSTGERTFFNMHGADSKMMPEDIDVAKLDCDIFHLAYLLLLDGMDSPDDEYGTKAAKLLANVQSRGIKTSIDIVSEQSERFVRVVRPALKYCDYVTVNEVEGARATGLSAVGEDGRISIENLRTICNKLLEIGVRERVTVHCPEVGVSLDRSGNFAVVPSLDLPKGWIVGSVGAGDAFCAGMLYSLLKNKSAEEGLRIASCAAAMNLSVADSVSGARSLAETMDLESKFSRKRL